MILERLRHPIVQAPMGGGIATPALAAAVSEGGGLGFLSGARRAAASLERDLLRLRAATARPFGVNLWVPADRRHEPRAWAPLAADEPPRLVDPGAPDEHWDAKLALLRGDPPAVVSFSFGLPDPSTLEDLRAAGAEVWATASSTDQARLAAEAGVDALVVQGAEAAAATRSDRGSELSVLALLRLARRTIDLPLVAAGGIADGAAVAAALAATATAVQVGSAFMLAREAGTSPEQRAALREERHLVTVAALRRGGDARLFAGQTHALAEELPAGEIVRQLSEEALLALEGAALRLRER